MQCTQYSSSERSDELAGCDMKVAKTSIEIKSTTYNTALFIAHQLHQPGTNTALTIPFIFSPSRQPARWYWSVARRPVVYDDKLPTTTGGVRCRSVTVRSPTMTRTTTVLRPSNLPTSVFLGLVHIASFRHLSFSSC